ncbi:MAG: transcription termination factor Rho [Caldilineaceae bacterium]|nr:transcription termination factor Rho [Caldilineaceae bacterium]
MAETIQGVLEVNGRRGGYVRDPDLSFAAAPDDVWVAPALVSRFGLITGATVTGTVRKGKKGRELATVETICGLTPDEFQARTPFERLTAISPDRRFPLGDVETVSMRVVDLIAPLGRGSRALIVAPPKAGKTQLLEELAGAIRTVAPAARIIALLIDERPEEVTHFRRSVPVEVLASSNDESLESHVHLAEMTMAHVRCELECGRDVIVLVDSITRMTRAFNLAGRGAGRTMSGGVDARALEIPRRFFGLARNIEHGGSVTVIATTLVETGSRMDDLIYEEFKGTGNSEVVLDRSLAEARIFPAINVAASGTRRDELLYGEDDYRRLVTLRRWLAGGSPKAAINGLLKLIHGTENNAALLARLKPADV